MTNEIETHNEVTDNTIEIYDHQNRKFKEVNVSTIKKNDIVRFMDDNDLYVASSDAIYNPLNRIWGVVIPKHPIGKD